MISIFSIIFSTGYFDLSMKDFSLCEWVFYLHVCVCTGPERPEESTGSPGTGVRDGCEHMSARNGTWVPYKKKFS